MSFRIRMVHTAKQKKKKKRSLKARLYFSSRFARVRFSSAEIKRVFILSFFFLQFLFFVYIFLSILARCSFSQSSAIFIFSSLSRKRRSRAIRFQCDENTNEARFSTSVFTQINKISEELIFWFRMNKYQQLVGYKHQL